MNSTEGQVLDMAQIARNSAAMNEAALARDFDEARFRAQLVAEGADAAGHVGMLFAVARVLDRLGPPGSIPKLGYGDAMLALARSLDKVGLDPL